MSPVQDICPTARVRLVGGAPATCGRPPQAGSRQGLRYSLPVTKTNSRINQTHCSGISFGDFLRGFPPPHRPASKGLPLGLRIFTAAMLQDPARADQPPPSRGLLGDSSWIKHAGLHRREPRTSSCHQPQPAYALCGRQEHPPSRRGTPEFNAASPPHKLASQLPCRKLSTPSAT